MDQLAEHRSEEVFLHRAHNEFPDESTNPHIPKLCFQS
jgi:hypothetical protein